MTAKDTLLANLVAQKLESQRADTHLQHPNTSSNTSTKGDHATSNANDTVANEGSKDQAHGTAKAA